MESPNLSPRAERASHPRQRRLKTKRLVALLFPLVVVLLVELVLRIGGWYNEPPSDDKLFEDGVEFFTDWNGKLEQPKPKKEFRVFALGGSSTYGIGAEQPFSDLLEARLSDSFPDRDWNVINGGVPAYGSHRVLAVARRAYQFDPDLIVIYLGHNEFLEDIFYDPDGIMADIGRFQHFARRFHLVRWLSDVFKINLQAPRPKLQQHFAGNTNFPLIKSPKGYHQRIRFLESNLDKLFEEAGDVPIVVIPAVPNLLAPPGFSQHGAAYESNAQGWQDHYLQAKVEMEAAQWKRALAALDSAHRIDSKFAMSHYLRGQVLWSLGKRNEAREAFVEANRYDRCGDRVTPGVSDAIVGRCRNAGVTCLDLGENFHSIALSGSRPVPGKNGKISYALFTDHCHPNQAGHENIAEAAYQAICRRLQPSQTTEHPMPGP